MAAEKPASPKPTIGRIVIFRNRAGIDYPAIITEVTDETHGFVQLYQFPPPHQGPETPTDREWGWPHESQVLSNDPRSCWRWPERS